MLLQLVNVLYVLVAIAMIGLILMQRGAGAQAGSGFGGGGASATVFGARGASNFLSKSTKWLAVMFFVISLGMAYYASKVARDPGSAAVDLGVMGGLAKPSRPAPASPDPARRVPTAGIPVAPATQPAAPVSVPQYAAPVAAPAEASNTPASPAPEPAQGK